MSDLKVAQVCPKYFPSIGGVETHVKEISERLVNRGVDVSVLTTDPTCNLPIEETINGVKVKRFKSWAPSEAYFFSRGLKNYLLYHSSEYDIVHAHSYHAFPSLYAAKGKGSNRLIYTPHYHGTGHTFFRSLLHLPYKYLAKEVFTKADLVIFVSEYEKNLALKAFSLRKIVIIPNGLNLKEIKKLNKVPGKPFILYVGRLEKYKGVDYAINALPYLDTNISLEIVGRGPYKNDLITLTNKLDLMNRVRFFEDLSKGDLLKKYSDASLFVMLSSRESFGITVAEALAAGTPCIVANASALRQWVDDKNCFGLDLPIKLGDFCPLISQVMGKTVDFKGLLDWDDVAKETAQLYQVALERRSS